MMVQKKLRQLGQIKGGIPAPRDLPAAGVVPFVRMSDLGDVHMSPNFTPTREFLPENLYRAYRDKVLEPGAILFPRSGSVHLNHRAILATRAVVVSHIGAILANPDVDSRFLYYLLCNYDMTGIMTQTTGLNMVQFGQLYEREFSVPASREEQSCVALVLSTVDRAIEQTEALMAKYQRIKAGLMHDLLTRGIDEHGNLRDPATHKFKDSPLGMIPDKWQVSSIDTEFDIVSGFTLGQHRRPRENRRRYLRVANVQRGYINLDEVAELGATDSEMQGRVLKENDLLIVEGHASPDQVGRCAMVSAEAAGLTFQNHLFRLRSRRVEPGYALAWLNSSWARAYWRRVCGTSSGLNTINRTMLRSLLIAVPGTQEQRRIINTLEIQTRCIWLEHSLLQTLARVKNGLMQDLLTGKVSVDPLLGQHGNPD